MFLGRAGVSSYITGVKELLMMFCRSEQSGSGTVLVKISKLVRRPHRDALERVLLVDGGHTRGALRRIQT